MAESAKPLTLVCGTGGFVLVSIGSKACLELTFIRIEEDLQLNDAALRNSLKLVLYQKVLLLLP